MAYAVKYRLDYTDVLGVLNRIDISLDDYTGSISNPIGGPVPLTLSMLGDGNKFQPIIGTEATITLVGTTVFEYEEFFACKNKDYKVEHYIDSVLNFSGYVQPDMYTEPLGPSNYLFQLRATDMLGDLHSLRYESAAATPYTGNESEIVIIS